MNTKVNGECRRYERLALDLAEGRALLPEDRAFRQVHLADCPACRAELKASALLDDSDGEEVTEPLDQVSRRRLVNAVLERANAMPAPVRADAASSGPGRRWVWAAAAAVVVLVGSGLTVGLLYRAASTPERPPKRDAPRARILLKAGQIEVNGSATKVGQALEPGQTLRVQNGRAALGLPGRATVLLGPGSRVQIDRLAAGQTQLRLLRGTLVATLPPSKGRPRFVVTTPAGRVEVTGTIFQVKVGTGRVTVAVLRGQIRVREPGRAARAVDRGLVTVLKPGPGARSVRPLSEAEERLLWPAVQTVSLLAPSSVTTVQIDSRPVGATVRLDTLVLGQTPLSARVPTGTHLLMVERAGYRTVREQLAIRPGEQVRRDYALEEQVAPPPSPPAATKAPPTPAPRPDTPKGSPSGTRTSPAPPLAPTPPTAQDLLSRARRHRSGRQWAAAAMAYKTLIKQHPASPEARSGRVSLGLILLDHLGNPNGALSLFSAYLAQTRRGALAQEAAYGRIRALRRLGRHIEERVALREFLRRYPTGLQAPLVRQRLKQLDRQAP